MQTARPVPINDMSWRELSVKYIGENVSRVPSCYVRATSCLTTMHGYLVVLNGLSF